MKDRLTISILVDDPGSWIIPFARDLMERLAKSHRARLYFAASEVGNGDMLFLLGCTSIIPGKVLQKNTHNFVVHESDLPKGRGWSPVSWQILEGKHTIPIVLFEAAEEVDAGPIYLKEYFELDGTELLPEIKRKQGAKTVEMVVKLLEQWPNVTPFPQQGTPDYYPKRTREHDKLDVDKSLAENFDHLRIVDNEKYPAWFEYKGRKYIIKIYPST